MSIFIAGGDAAAMLAGISIKRNAPRTDVTIWTGAGAPSPAARLLTNPVAPRLALDDATVLAALETLAFPLDGVRVARSRTSVAETCDIPGLAYSTVCDLALSERLQDLARQAGCHMATELPADVAKQAGRILVAERSLLGAVGADEAAFGFAGSNGSKLFAQFETGVANTQLSFAFAETPAGVFAAMLVPWRRERASLLIEADESAIAEAGLLDARADRLQIFAEETFVSLLFGAAVKSNGLGWQCASGATAGRLLDGRVALFGQAACGLHPFSGLQTRIGLLQAEALGKGVATADKAGDDSAEALAAWAGEAMKLGASAQRAAHAGAEWLTMARWAFDLPIEQFAFGCVTRSHRMGYKRVREAAPHFAREIDALVAGGGGKANDPPPPMFAPYELRGMKAINRMVFSPMCMYSAVDGTVNDFHLAHLGARAVGGFGLVIAEMTNVTAQGRMTPGCAGMYLPEHGPAWKRVVDHTHQHTQAKIGIQLAHAGRKGSIGRSWEKYDPVKGEEMWEVIAPSPIPFTADRPTPREMTQADIKATVDAFARAARMSEEAGFDMIELHMAHGYLLSEFISPLANKRDDAYGGSLANRMRFPLEVFEAVRAVFPADKPIAARISANDFRPDGVTPEEAIEISRMLRDAGIDIVAVSTAGVTADRRPAAMNRLYQLALSEAIRHAAKVPTMAIGGIVSHTDCNMIIASGRADLCVMARGAMNEPYFPHHAGNEQGWRFDWPLPYARADETVIRRS